jgi:hypothetical protein
MRALSLFLFVPFLALVASFSPSVLRARSLTQLSLESSRRQALGGFVGFVASVGSAPAWADIYDGNQLPQGAAQFSRLLKVKTDISASARTFIVIFA